MIRFLLFDFIFLIAFYLSGSFILFLCNEQPDKAFTRFFLKIILGVFGFIILYSILISHGNTVNIGFIILIVAALFANKKPKPGQRLPFMEFVKIKPEIILTALFILIIFFFYKCNYLFNSGFTDPVVPNTDYVFYSRLSHSLNSTGIESARLSYLEPHRNNPVPYHYFEVWLNAGLSFFSRSLTLLSGELCSHILLITMISIGFLAVAETYTKISIREIVCAVLLCFFSSILYYSLPGFTFYKGQIFFAINVFTFQKLSIIYLFLISILLLLIHRKNEIALYTLLGLALATILAAPSAISTVFILIALGFGLPKILKSPGKRGYGGLVLNNVKQSLNITESNSQKFSLYNINLFRLTLISIPLTLFVILFYYINNNVNGLNPDMSFMEAFLLTIQNKTVFRQALIYIIKNPLELIFLFFPVLLVCVFSYRFLLKVVIKFPLLFLFAIMIMVCLFASASIISMFDSMQIYDNICFPIVNILLFIAFHYILIKEPTRYKTILNYSLFIYFILMNIYNTNESLNKIKQKSINTYSDEYKKNVTLAIRAAGNRGGFLANTNDFRRNLSKNLNIYAYRDFLSFEFNDLEIFPLNYADEIPLSPDPIKRKQEEGIIKSFSFNNFTENQKKENNFRTLNQSREDFINSNNLRFLFLTKGTSLDSIFENKIKSVISDSVSGEKLIVFK